MRHRFPRALTLLMTLGLTVPALTMVQPAAAERKERAERVGPRLDRAQYEVARTDDVIDEARSAVSRSQNDLAERELAAAVEMQVSARATWRAGRPREAVDLTLGARSHAVRAIEVIRGLPDSDRVQAQLQRTRELIGRSRARIEGCNDPRAHGLLHGAIAMQERAESSYHDDRYLAALQLTTSARDRILVALRTCRFQEDVNESAERALRRTDEVIARARERVADSGGELGRRALSRAVEIQERAVEEYRAQRHDESLRLTQTARAFAYRALRRPGRIWQR